MSAKTTTTGGYVYRTSDNLFIGKIDRDGTGTQYGTPARRASNGLDRVYGTRPQIITQLLDRADAWDRTAEVTR